MAITINGIEMPTTCADCPFCDYEEAHCLAANDKPTTERRYNEREPWCPLEEVPTVLYLCDRRDPTCLLCCGPCNATKNVEHAAGFVRTACGEYADMKLFMKKHQRAWDDQAIATTKEPNDG